jgi:uncharacterized protein (TIGR03437 family)
LYSANVNIGYGSSQTLTISVSFTVVSTNVISISPASASWNYAPGGTAPFTNITITAGTTDFNAVANASWLLLSFPNAPSYYPPSSSVTGFATSIGLTVLYNTGATTPAVGTTGTVTISDTNGNSTLFTVTFNGAGSGSSVVTITPSSVALSCAANSGASCNQATVQVTSTLGGSLSVALSSPVGSYVSVAANNSSISAGGSVSVVLTANATGLSSVSYSGTMIASVISSGITYQNTIPVSFVVGSSASTSSVQVAPSTLSFSADANNPTAVSPQYLSVTATGNYSVTVSGTWLTVGGSASGTSGGLSNPSLVEMIPTATGLPAGTYTATVTVTTPSGSTPVTATLTVYNGPTLYITGGTGNGASMNVTENAGNLVGTVPFPFLNASDSSVMTVHASTSTPWLSLSTITNTTPSAGFQVFFSAANLANGVYIGAVTFTSSSAANSPMTLPVVLSVSGSSIASGISLAQSSINLNTPLNGSSQSAALSILASTSTSFTASSNATWLTLSQSSGTAPATITVTASSYGLPVGTYYGTITVTGGGTQATAQVTFVIGNSGSTGGNVISNPSSLTFNYTVNGGAPSTQTLTISNAVSGTAGISFTVSASPNSGTINWLTAAVNGSSSGVTQATVVVSVTTASLSAGTYYGTVTIYPSGGNSLSIPVTLNVQGPPAVTATPSTLTYTYQAGATAPPSQAIQVSGSSSGLNYSVSVSTTSGGSWLVVSKTSGTTGATGQDVFSVSVSPSTLAAGGYQGTIVVQGTGTATGTATINVVLTVTAPFPTITSVLNAASFQSGPVSPGELVSIFGTAMGPAAPLQTTVDPVTGKVETSLGNMQVLFNGYAAPLTYVTATQINCVVPYELAQLSSPYVQVKYLGQSSNTYNLQAAATAPGIFTTTQTGKGQGAILNSNNTVNSTSNPAAAGSTIQVYMTGEGQLSPAGVTGSVTCSAGCATLSKIPVPLLAVAALVNNQPATVSYYGEVSGLVSGIMQVNVVIPPNTPSGSVPIVITVGSNSSPSGASAATVAVQ